MDFDIRNFHINTIINKIPIGYRDLSTASSIILEYNLDRLIGWQKGCYLGQELMSRTKYQGIVRKGPTLVVLISNIEYKHNDEELISITEISNEELFAEMKSLKVKNLIMLNNDDYNIIENYLTNNKIKYLNRCAAGIEQEKKYYIGLGLSTQDNVIIIAE
jgi:folate-binding protein YgfZ